MVAGLNKENMKDKVANTGIYLFLLVIAFFTLYPFWYCLIGSLNDGTDYMKGGIFLWPRIYTLANYKAVLVNKEILDAYRITVFRTVIGTILALAFTSVFAYAYSRKILRFKKFYMYVCLIPMYFSGGLIPTYLLYTKLHLINNFMVYIIPALFSFWNVIIMQSFFRGIPDSLIESAAIDGAGEYRIYFNIIMPLSKPVLAAIALFVAVGHWNSYFDSMVFTSSKELQTVQVLLMKIVRNREMAAKMADTSREFLKNRADEVTSETIQLATMMSVTLPIVFIYPFLQKYFIKGMLIGSIKG